MISFRKPSKDTPIDKTQDIYSEESLDQLLFDNFKWIFALRAFNIGVWDYDADKERVTFSDESKKLLGYEDDELGNNPDAWNDLVHEDDREKYFKDFQDHLNGKTPIYENISRVKCKDGSYKWVMDKGMVLERTEDGKEKRIIGVHVDITEAKENENALEDSMNLINNQNNKLKNFAFIVTHNLKEHAGNFESLLDFYDQAETLEEKETLIEHIRTVSKSLSNTIGDLREIVSVDSKKPDETSPINLFKQINSIIRMLELEIQETKAIVKNNMNQKQVLQFNKAYLDSIIQNLLTNALKYRHPERLPVIIIDSLETHEGLVVTISDNGIGIDLEKYGSEFFGLYRTFHKNKNAEGIGLYLTKSQIEAFGGSIKVDSSVNVGTTFTLLFPKELCL
ncbi:PAS domain-containing protein [Winogradskyella sp. 3972H.M.0a.05]|uniref:sensor histidine kinase n=1 Tax=Winogradskyella sp. 3972H.M.0a.05 TaxID=2950277 RepID=UPI00339685BA